jgi:hypothetical protein
VYRGRVPQSGDCVVLQDREYEVEAPIKDVGRIPLVALKEDVLYGLLQHVISGAASGEVPLDSLDRHPSASEQRLVTQRPDGA